MKKIYLLWIPVLCLLWRCNENDHMTWEIERRGLF